jgi:hypothetical protein
MEKTPTINKARCIMLYFAERKLSKRILDRIWEVIIAIVAAYFVCAGVVGTIHIVKFLMK